MFSAFDRFYREVYLPEHRHPANIALHIGGTLAGLGWIIGCLIAPWPWPVAGVLFPAVHAAPGLLGHRLFERNATVGDLRVTRRDHSPWLFLLANHRLTAEWLGWGR
jgi:hypothetical protein